MSIRSISPLNFIPSLKHKVAVLFLVFLCSIASTAFCIGDSTNQEIKNFRTKLHRIQKGIDSQEDDIRKSSNQERSVLLELEILDKKLAERQAKLDEFENQIVQQQTLIEQKNSRLNEIYSKKKRASNHLGKRIKAYYTMGHIGLLNVTFSTKALPELLQFHDAFDEMIKYDQAIIATYRKTIDDIERTKSVLTLEEGVLQDFMEQVVIEKKEIIRTTDKKKELLTHIRTQTKLNKQAISEMQEVSEALSNALVTLKNKTNAQEYRFSDNKGSLPPPVDGVIVTLFEQENTNKLGISRKSPGITLSAADGTEIKAIAEGDVLFSGYLRGYGNTVIIHHGYQYYSVTSRIEKLLVHQGENVKSGSVLGIMGNAATLFEGGLYLEIRHGKQPLDPLLWLNPNQLSTSHELTDKTNN